MAKSYFKVTQIKLAPLLPAAALQQFDPDKVLRRLRNEVLKKVRDSITQTTFSSRAKIALAKAIKMTIGPRSLTISSTHPAFRIFIEGRRKRQMKWLVKARAPIPIITESGVMIFRSATPKSMQDGKWVHPGSKSSDFFDKARGTARKTIKARLMKEFQAQLKAGINKGAKSR
jgi:hypothetical protein